MDNNIRPESLARITTKEAADRFIDEQVQAVRAQVGDKTGCSERASRSRWSRFSATG